MVPQSTYLELHTIYYYGIFTIFIVVKNRQGEDLMDFLGNTGMRVVNGRGGKDGFTCVSGMGSSLVDYCIVEVENLGWCAILK